MSAPLVVIIVTAAMIALTALYVAAEFATVSARKAKLRQEAESGSSLARMLVPIVDDPQQLDNYIAACQVGITVASLILGYYGQSAIGAALTPLLVGFGGEAAAQSISTVLVLVVLTTFTVVFGELVPKSVALRYPERTALFTVLPMRWSVALFRPLIIFFNGTATLILRTFGVPPAGGHAHVHSPEEIELLVAESAKGGLLDGDERELLNNAFHITDMRASDVMVPRTRLTAAPLETALPDVLSLAAREGYSRIPLYRGSIDDIAGIVHIRDLYRLYVAGQTDVQPVLRSVPFVPESLSAADVWNQLRQTGSYVAIVFDEHGGTAGMITVEDLIEEIFGSVEDEFDAEPLSLTAGIDGRVQVDGGTSIAVINQVYHLSLPEGEIQSIGGLVLGALGRAPQVGDAVSVGSTTLHVEAIDGNAVTRLSFAGAGSSEQHASPEAP
jgi:putative hemolysin